MFTQSLSTPDSMQHPSIYTHVYDDYKYSLHTDTKQ